MRINPSGCPVHRRLGLWLGVLGLLLVQPAGYWQSCAVTIGGLLRFRSLLEVLVLALMWLWL